MLSIGALSTQVSATAPMAPMAASTTNSTWPCFSMMHDAACRCRYLLVISCGGPWSEEKPHFRSHSMPSLTWYLTYSWTSQDICSLLALISTECAQQLFCTSRCYSYSSTERASRIRQAKAGTGTLSRSPKQQFVIHLYVLLTRRYRSFWLSCSSFLLSTFCNPLASLLDSHSKSC